MTNDLGWSLGDNFVQLIALVILQIIADNAIYFMVFYSDMQFKRQDGQVWGLDAGGGQDEQVPL